MSRSRSQGLLRVVSGYKSGVMSTGCVSPEPGALDVEGHSVSRAFVHIAFITAVISWSRFRLAF